MPSQLRTMWPMWPPPPFEGATSAAPAPSANRAAVPRSVRSMKRLSTSAPITSTFWRAAALDLGGGELERGQEAGARRAHVHRAGARGAELGRHRAGRRSAGSRRRRRSPRARGPRPRRHARLVERRGRPRGEILRRSPGRHVPALVHAGAVDDPLLGHARALGDGRVRDDALRHGHRDGRQGGRALMAVPRHGGRRRRRCGVGGGIAHGRPRVRPQEVRAMHGLPPSPASDFRTRFVRTWPGPVSTKLVTPRASSARITSSQRTGSVIARTSSAADVVERLGGHARVDRHARLADLGLVHERAERLDGGSISGEGKAPATGSRLPRTPRSFSCASASSRR